MIFVIRAPNTTDADDLGRVHVRAWQRAYRGGLMPDQYLDELSVEERASMWRQALTNEPRPRAARLVGECDDGTPGNTRARACYESRGWYPDELERHQEVLGVTVPEIRYSKSL